MRTFEQWLNDDFFPQDRLGATPKMAYNAALATANERIRELEAKCSEWEDDENKAVERCVIAEQAYAAEREVSGKLVAALQKELGVWKYDKEYSVSDYSRLHVDQRIETISAALSEVAAFRAKQGGEG